MDTVRIPRGDPRYPMGLEAYLGDDVPPFVDAMGDLRLLSHRKLALFCSVRCPGKLIVRTYDLAQALREIGPTALGGFHSPMEKECLAVLLRGPKPVILCPARTLVDVRSRVEHRGPLEGGRLLLLSGFEETERRVTEETAVVRNRFVAALADAVFVAHAEPGGKTEQFCREVLARGKPLYTLDGDANANLLALGARPVSRAADLGSHGD